MWTKVIDAIIDTTNAVSNELMSRNIDVSSLEGVHVHAKPHGGT
jgi:hypothetical protein